MNIEYRCRRCQETVLSEFNSNLLTYNLMQAMEDPSSKYPATWILHTFCPYVSGTRIAFKTGTGIADLIGGHDEEK
jgi:hypothetical protein